MIYRGASEVETSLQAYLKENVRHGQAGFPAAFYHCVFPKAFHDMPTHWHEEMEVTLVRSGELDYSIGLLPYHVSAGDLLFVRPGTLHAAHKSPSLQAVEDSVVFHLDLLGLESEDLCTKQFIRPLRDGELMLAPVVHPEQPHYEQLLRCFLLLWDCRRNDLPYRPLALKSALFQLLQEAVKLSGRLPAQPADQLLRPYEEKLKPALAYIQEHYSEPITIARLAALCGFSPVHFMNIFKKAIGTTCIDYLVKYRLALAAMELRETGNPVIQVAMNSGFQTVSYFNRAFRKEYHMTPRQYRKGEQPEED